MNFPYSIPVEERAKAVGETMLNIERSMFMWEIELRMVTAVLEDPGVASKVKEALQDQFKALKMSIVEAEVRYAALEKMQAEIAADNETPIKN